MTKGKNERSSEQIFNSVSRFMILSTMPENSSESGTFPGYV